MNRRLLVATGGQSHREPGRVSVEKQWVSRRPSSGERRGVGVVQECDAGESERARELVQIGLHDVAIDLHERVEAEREVDARVADHRQRAPVVDV